MNTDTDLDRVFEIIREAGVPHTNGALFQDLCDKQIELEISAVASWAEGIVFNAGKSWQNIAASVRITSKED